MMTKILLADIEFEGIDILKIYEQFGGYKALKTALQTKTPEDIVEEVKLSGLRGRGGAGFPTGMKWSFLAKPENKPRYLICNADESEPGTFKDRFLMTHKPHLLIEGIILSSYALGANKSFIYVRGEMMPVIKKLEFALYEAKQSGYLGSNILGSGYDLEIYVQPGAGAYICGEETALLESLEGKRGNPRLKPPFPAVEGLYNCPTVINNVETISNIPWIISNGASQYGALGTQKSSGTKLISACGNINNPGVYEIELGLPVEEFIYSEKYCNGIKNNKKLKAVIPGGSSVPILPANLILQTASGQKRLLSYESLSDGGFETGSMLGSGGFIVLDEDACIVKNTLNLARFYHHESCGQCSPCREGTGWLEKILNKLESGYGTYDDITLLVQVAKNIEGKTICPLGDAAAWPVASAVRHFKHEFVAHVEKKALVNNN